MKAQASETKAHAKLSASGSGRWLSCPGSVALSENAPPQKESEYATEGTDAHACLEFLMKNRNKLQAAGKFALKKWPETMVGHATDTVEYIKRFEKPGVEILCETRADLSFVQKGMFGTIDISVVELFGTLRITDYKYGAGVAVDPDSTQLIYYALAIAHKYGFNFEDVVLEIIQPRADHEKGPRRQHRMMIEELMAWEEKFRKGAEATEDPLAPLKSGEHCRWCPAKTICPEISTRAFAQAQVDFAPEKSATLVIPIPGTIPAKQLGNILEGVSKLETWIEAVKAHALHTLERGIKIPGFKLVQKRSIRKWKDDGVGLKLRGHFGAGVFEQSILSPAQLEKKFSDEPAIGSIIAKYSTSESSGVTIAPEKDKRAEINPLSEFSSVTEPKMKTISKRKK